MRHDIGAYIKYRESNLLKAAQCPAGGRTVNFHPSEAQAVDSCGKDEASNRDSRTVAHGGEIAAGTDVARLPERSCFLIVQ